MRTKSLSALLLSLLILTACKTTVVSDEDRELPPPSEPEVVDELIDTEPSPSAPDGATEDKEVDEVEEVVEDDLEVEEVVDTDTDEPAAEPEAAASVTKTADLSQSFIAFTGTKGSAVSHEGKFGDFAVSVNFPAGSMDFAQSIVSMSLNVSSMVTDSNSLTTHLLADDFFSAQSHPTATFTSTSITHNGGSDYSITGNLTIKGVTQTVTMAATYADTYLLANYALDRTVFGVGESGSIDATVPIEVKIVFQ